MKMLLLFAILSSTAFAAPKHAPLPLEVVTAKTVYIANETGNQSITDGAYEELSKWGKYTISPSKKGADLVLRFTKVTDLDGGTSSDHLKLVVTAASSDDALYQVLPKGPHLTWSSVSRASVDEFRQWVDKK